MSAEQTALATRPEGARPLVSEIEQARAARAYLEVDLAAIRHNLGVISRFAPGAQVMAVVKGDAYGLGARAVSRALAACGVAAFAVDNVAEGIALRKAGLRQPILIIDGDLPENAPRAIAHQLMPGIADEELLLAYERAAAQWDVTLPIWLAANVGFNRSGYRRPEHFARFARQARACKHIKVKAIYAHLTNSNSDAETSIKQIAEFQRLVRRAQETLGPELGTSLFASHGLMRWAKAFPTDWVRPGLILYGEHAFMQELIEPEAVKAVQQLRSAVRLRARIIHLLDFESEEGVGYGQRYTTKPRQRLATVSIGFGSGYPCGARKLHALVHGQRVPLFGEVGMDALQLDVTGIPEAQLYDWVTLIGADGNDHISVHALARAATMTPYELLSQLYCHRLYVETP